MARAHKRAADRNARPRLVVGKQQIQQFRRRKRRRDLAFDDSVLDFWQRGAQSRMVPGPLYQLPLQRRMQPLAPLRLTPLRKQAARLCRQYEVVDSF